MKDRPGVIPACLNQAIRIVFRAVSRSRGHGKPVVLGNRLDRFDHQIPFVTPSMPIGNSRA